MSSSHVFGAIGAALLLAVGLSAGAVGAAAAPAAASTLFVENIPNSNCNDTGPGTQTEPFCTIQAAADVVVPGQTVSVGHESSGLYFGDVQITRSGTPDAPIIFTAGDPWFGNLPAETVGESITGTKPAHAFTLTGVHDVNIENFGVADTTGTGIVVTDSTDVTIDHIEVSTGATLAGEPTLDGVDVTGTSSGVTIDRSLLAASGDIVSVQNGVTGTTVVNNRLELQGATAGVAVRGATGTDIVNNSTECGGTCGATVDVGDGSTSTSIENNVILAAASPTPAISVSADSTTQSTVDYNVLDAPQNPNAYSWAGTGFATPAALQAATGQGAHDVTSNHPFGTNFVPLANSPAIDSADATAPGAPATDSAGNLRVDDPLVPNTGTGAGFADRGAVELQDPITVAVAMSASKAPTGGTVTATVTATSPWAPVTQYTVNFGDGTPDVQSTTPAVQHVFTSTGTFTVTATATDGTGHASPPAPNGNVIVIDTPAPLVVHPQTRDTGALSVGVHSTATSGWSTVSATYDFGDGSAPVTDAGPGVEFQHTYAAVGTYTITATVTDAGGNTTSSSIAYNTTGSRFVAFGPTRVLDTRSGTGTGGKVAKVAANSVLRLKIGGTAGIPVGVTSVALNITATNPTDPSFVTVYPDGVIRPTSSTLNVVAHQTVANATIVPVGADGFVDLYNHVGSIDLIADVTGYFVRNPQASGYTPMAPHRLLDTRVGTGAAKAKVAANGTVGLKVAGVGGVPATGVTAVAFNVTVVSPTAASGFVTAFPDGVARPDTSSLNFTRGQTIANMLITPVGADGKVNLFNGSAGTTDLVADVAGYFMSGSGGDAYVPVTPYRAFDTRTTTSIPARKTNIEPINTTAGSVGPDLAALVLNVTVTDTTGAGFVTVFADGEAMPATSNLNWTAGQTVPNLAIPNAAGSAGLNVFNGSESKIDVLGDVLGYFGGPAA